MMSLKYLTKDISNSTFFIFHLKLHKAIEFLLTAVFFGKKTLKFYHQSNLNFYHFHFFIEYLTKKNLVEYYTKLLFCSKI